MPGSLRTEQGDTQKMQNRIAVLVPSFLTRNFQGHLIIWMTFIIGDCITGKRLEQELGKDAV